MAPSCRLWARGLPVPLIHPGPAGCSPGLLRGWASGRGPVPPGRGGSSWALQAARVTPFLRLLTREGRMELQKGLRTCVRARGSWTALLVLDPVSECPGTPGETGRRVGGTRASA